MFELHGSTFLGNTFVCGVNVNSVNVFLFFSPKVLKKRDDESLVSVTKTKDLIQAFSSNFKLQKSAFIYISCSVHDFSVCSRKKKKSIRSANSSAEPVPESRG